MFILRLDALYPRKRSKNLPYSDPETEKKTLHIIICIKIFNIWEMRDLLIDILVVFTP